MLPRSLGPLHFDPNSARLHSRQTEVPRWRGCLPRFDGNTRLHKSSSSANEQDGQPTGHGGNALSHADLFFFCAPAVLQHSDVRKAVMLTTQHLADGG